MRMLDLFIYHPKEPGHLFNVQTKVGRFGNLMFSVTELRWNEDRQENDETKLPSMMASVFAAWWDIKHDAGWRVQA